MLSGADVKAPGQVKTGKTQPISHCRLELTNAHNGLLNHQTPNSFVKKKKNFVDENGFYLLVNEISHAGEKEMCSF